MNEAKDTRIADGDSWRARRVVANPRLTLHDTIQRNDAYHSSQWKCPVRLNPPEDTTGWLKGKWFHWYGRDTCYCRNSRTSRRKFWCALPWNSHTESRRTSMEKEETVKSKDNTPVGSLNWTGADFVFKVVVLNASKTYSLGKLMNSRSRLACLSTFSASLI